MSETKDAPALTKREEGQFTFMARCYDSHDAEQRLGYRSALFDAVHLLDAMRLDLGPRDKLSKAKQAEAERIQRMADLIWAFHEDRVSALKLPSPTPEG